MNFPVPQFATDLIRRWWDGVCDAVDQFLAIYTPADGEAPLRIPRSEARSVNAALDMFEAVIRRILVVMCAELGPTPAPGPLAPLLFCIEEAPSAPVIRQPREVDPDYCLKAPPERALHTDSPSDGLVSSARLLKRLAALAHVFDNGQLYLDAMCARLCAHLKPLRAELPAPFTAASLPESQAADLRNIHQVSLSAQAYNSS
ncbi:MAG: hypothetical protein VR75_02270 [Hyphomonadaceae bacterium BRH_c29]|nr:MAG: hypothetical protein VR75_02270 [Hyphomonadaceae bacterium BRH_c29]